MSVTLTAIAGNQQVSIVLKRPSWARVSQAYSKIGLLNATDSYKLVGGNVYELHLDNPIDYANACAIRMSYALNNGGYKIHSGTIFQNKNIGRLKGGDKFAYIYRVQDMIYFIEGKWGEAEVDSRKLDIKFSNISKILKNKKGVIIFTIKGWGDASGHATFWDGDNTMDGSTYHINPMYKDKIVRIQFWELK